MTNAPEKLMLGDCLDRLKELPDNSVDSIVTDPPYGISFMAKKWDYDVPSVDVWNEAMRVLKPGGHALIACGTRTQHRMVVNIEDAGFEIRDVVSWIYGSGFPKSLSISKAIDKQAGAEREVVGEGRWNSVKGNKGKDGGLTTEGFVSHGGEKHMETLPATESAKQWDGWGTAMKPAVEFFTLCRKPLSEKTIAANVLKWGTGGINVDGCRVEGEIPAPRNAPKKIMRGGKFHASAEVEKEMSHFNPTQGRFPANLIHDGSQEVLDLFPVTKSGIAVKKNLDGRTYNAHQEWGLKAKAGEDIGYGDKGSAARFFYAAKASKKDREEGNTHPTVKPTALMAYLCRLITPTGGTVLDPYMGSGSTGKAARREGFRFVGIEREPEYMAIAESRITNAI